MKRPFKTKNKRKDASAATHVDRIFGIHAVRAAITNPKREVRALYATANGLSRISDLEETGTLGVIDTSPAELSRRLGSDTVHQGVLLEATPLTAPDLDAALQLLDGARPLVVLDQVTDPHNVGAILRSSAAFNAAAIIMTRRNSPPLDGALAKAASGAVEHVPVVLVTNLARALGELGHAGVQRIGLDGAAEQPLETAGLHAPCALVLGAEGKGLRRLTVENCDLLCRLTTPGPLRSLNVSNAAAVALHSLALRTK